MVTLRYLTPTLFFAALTLLQWHFSQAFFLGNKLGNLKVGSFHVRYFGPNYISGKETAYSQLVKILARYDIFLLQGTRDATGAALEDLKAKLNSTTNVSWGYVASNQLGRTKGSLERYAYFYRTKSAKLVTSYQVDDKANDHYAREPFCAEFAFVSSTKTRSKSYMHRENVVFVALHTPTTKTRQELEGLSKTVKSIAALYPRAAGVVALGDMNADCSYLSSKWREGALELLNGEGFKSLIPDSADTVVKGTRDCAYDRIVVYGKDVEVGRAKVFDFLSWLNLDEKDALDISDHYPVEFVLY